MAPGGNRRGWRFREGGGRQGRTEPQTNVMVRRLPGTRNRIQRAARTELVGLVYPCPGWPGGGGRGYDDTVASGPIIGEAPAKSRRAPGSLPPVTPGFRDPCMASQTLRCPCGHCWERPAPGPVPADIREICPACTAAVRAASTPAGGGAAAPGSELRPGDQLAGFEIIRPLNRGGMGIVYQARQVGMDRLAALKVIAPE